MTYVIVSRDEFFVGVNHKEKKLGATKKIEYAAVFDSKATANDKCKEIEDLCPTFSPKVIPYLEVNKEGITLKDDVELQKIAASLESYRLAVNYAIGADLITSIEYLEDEKHCEWVHVHYGTGGLLEVNVNIDSPQAVLKDVQKAVSNKGLL